MPAASAFGLGDTGMSMVMSALLTITIGAYSVSFEMSDSLIAAMSGTSSHVVPFYKPVVCIRHSDDNFLRDLAHKLYGCDPDPDRILRGDQYDQNGIRWIFEHADETGIFTCLTFDGFCADVLSFYENAFGLTARSVTRYADSPYAPQLTGGSSKICSAFLEFADGDCLTAIRLNDSLASARQNSSSYSPDDLLFYQGLYNPVITYIGRDASSVQSTFERLSSGAKLNKPFTASTVSEVNGSLIDRYGVCWNAVVS